jgi:hypothetical protein
MLYSFLSESYSGVSYLEYSGLEMAKKQGSDRLIEKRKIEFFLGQVRCQIACYNKLKMRIYVEFG